MADRRPRDDWGEIPFCPAVGYTVSVGDVTVDVDLVWRDGTLVTEAPPEALQWIDGFRPEAPDA